MEFLMQKIFDGHNDLLLRLWMEKDFSGSLFLDGGKSTNKETLETAKSLDIGELGHIDYRRAQDGGLSGGFFATFVPDQNFTERKSKTDFPKRTSDQLDQKYALKTTVEMMDIALKMAKLEPEKVKLLRSKNEIELLSFSKEFSAMAVLLHLEGAEAISEDLNELEELYDNGLRSLGPVWSRTNIFGYGVPFDFPGSPNVGPGLTDVGKVLIKECNAMGILVDLSHMNEAGFWDIAKISTKPLVATHSNVHSLSSSPRNLTSKQLDAIAESDGVVGLNFATSFLREDGAKNRNTSAIDMIKHLDNLLEKLGEGGVALGSDFDGAPIPQFIGDCSGLPNLVQAMKDAGYGSDLVDKICYKNWYDVLTKILK